MRGIHRGSVNSTWSHGSAIIRVRRGIMKVAVDSTLSVFEFIRACEKAKSMLPSMFQEQHLVKLLTNKLKGHAFVAVEDVTTVVSINDL